MRFPSTPDKADNGGIFIHEQCYDKGKKVWPRRMHGCSDSMGKAEFPRFSDDIADAATHANTESTKENTFDLCC